MLNVKNQSGFTVVELMVVVSIIALLAFVITPVIQSILPNMQLRKVTREFFLDSQEAKSSAIKNNTPIGITITTVACPGLPNNIPNPGGSYTLFTDDGSGGATAADGLQTGTEATIRTVNMPSRVALCNNAAQLGATSFITSGSLINPGTVTFTNNQGNSSTVTLSISGNVRSD